MDYTRLIKVRVTEYEIFCAGGSLDYVLEHKGMDTRKTYLVLTTEVFAWDIIGWPLRDMSMLIETTYADHQPL